MLYSCVKRTSLNLGPSLFKYIPHLSIHSRRKKSSKKSYKKAYKKVFNYQKYHKEQDEMNKKIEAVTLKQNMDDRSIKLNVHTYKYTKTWRTTINSTLMIGSVIIPIAGHVFVVMNKYTPIYFLGMWNLVDHDNIVASEVYLCTFIVEAIASGLNLNVEKKNKIRRYLNIIPALVNGCYAVYFLECFNNPILNATPFTLPFMGLHAAIMCWHLYEVCTK